MGLLSGKRGVIMGIANDRSIATSIAKALHKEGAKIAYSYLPDQGPRNRNYERIKQITGDLDPVFLEPCDVGQDSDIEAFFKKAGTELEHIDFIVHSIAFAPTEDIKKKTIAASREGFTQAMDISVYSLLKTCQAASPYLNEHASICALSYFGGEKVMPGYNLMGVCKSALEMAVRYAAYDLGEQKVRVNAISAGPIKTLAASAVGDFKRMLSMNEQTSPLRVNISAEDVANSALYLTSDLSKHVTGEILHVDSGFNIMGAVQ